MLSAGSATGDLVKLAFASQPPPHLIHEPSLSACFAHTDLEWRLAQIPADATVRGVFFTMLDKSAASFGPDTHHAFRDFFRAWDFSAIRLYPVRDYLTRLVLLAQMRYGAENIPRGIFEIQSGAYAAWRGTLMGKAMFQLMRGNLYAALQTTERAYAAHAVTSYSTLYVSQPAPGRIDARFLGEYVYIAEAMAGALVGMARVLGYEAEASTQLDGPFDGTVSLALRDESSKPAESFATENPGVESTKAGPSSRGEEPPPWDRKA